LCVFCRPFPLSNIFSLLQQSLWHSTKVLKTTFLEKNKIHDSKTLTFLFPALFLINQLLFSQKHTKGQRMTPRPQFPRLSINEGEVTLKSTSIIKISAMLFLLLFLFATGSTRLLQVYFHNNSAYTYPLEGNSGIQLSPISMESDYDQCNTYREIDGNFCLFLQSLQQQDMVTHFIDPCLYSPLRSAKMFLLIPRSPPFFVV